MKRTKEWWQNLSHGERIRLFALEHTHGGPYGGGGYLPDDCSECGGCGQPSLGVGLCHGCFIEWKALVEKASKVEIKA